MTFDIFGIDFYWRERLFGFWIVAFKNSKKETPRSLFTLYWADGELIVNLFWIDLTQEELAHDF